MTLKEGNKNNSIEKISAEEKRREPAQCAIILKLKAPYVVELEDPHEVKWSDEDKKWVYLNSLTK